MARARTNNDPSAPDADDFGGSDFIDPATLAGSGGNDADRDGPGNRGSDDRTFDPAIHIGPDRINADGTFRRKRKSGGKRGPRAASRSPISVSGIEAILLSVHAVAATSLRIPELDLDKSEAAHLAEAVAEVARHYPTTIDPRVMAWVNLTMVAGMVYGPRFYAIRARAKSNAPARRVPQPRRAPDATENPTPPAPMGDDPDLAALGDVLKRVQ